MSTAAELLTKSSYCRNSKHAKCKTAECECKCHALPDTTTTEADYLQAKAEAFVEGVPSLPEIEQQDHSVAEDAAAAVEYAEIIAAADPVQVAAVRDHVEEETGCGGCDNGEDCGAGCTDAAVAAARQMVLDRLDPSKAPAPALKPARKPKAPKEPKPVVKGTVDGKLSNAHKRAIRVQMVAYLAAMPVELTGDLEGVTPEEAAGYVDTYWVKYIDPARDKARHAK